MKLPKNIKRIAGKGDGDRLWSAMGRYWVSCIHPSDIPDPTYHEVAEFPSTLKVLRAENETEREFPVVLDNKQGDPIQLTLEFVLEVYEALHRKPPTLELE